MSRYRKHIFPIPIYHGTVENNNKLKKLLIPYIEEAKKDTTKNKPPDAWLTDSLVTSFKNDEVTDTLWNPENDLGKEIRYQYLKLIDSFFVERSWQINIEHIWYNYYVNGEWQEAHKHLSGGLSHSHYAFVHFLSFDPKIHTPLTFNDPLETHRSITPDIDPDVETGKYRPKVKEGDVVMFPTWLEHEVKPGKPTPNYPRISIALNFKLESYGEYDEEGNGE